MIVDKLLAFADGKAFSSTSYSDVVEVGGGDEIARTLNLVAQLDDCEGVTPDASSISASLEVSDNGSDWETVCSFGDVTVAECKAGKRLINFAKLPLGALRGQMRLKLTVTGTALTGAKYSAWLTPSAEAAM